MPSTSHDEPEGGRGREGEREGEGGREERKREIGEGEREGRRRRGREERERWRDYYTLPQLYIPNKSTSYSSKTMTSQCLVHRALSSLRQDSLPRTPLLSARRLLPNTQKARNQ